LVRDLASAETADYVNRPRTLDSQRFNHLVGQVSIFALDKVAPEWEAVKQAMDIGIIHSLSFDAACECENPIQYSLPCRHSFKQACLDGIPIPLSLFHPRWWLNGPPITNDSWNPSYNVLPLDYTSPNRNDITRDGEKIMAARDRLAGEARARFDNEMVTSNRQLLSFAAIVEAQSELPTYLPTRVEKPYRIRQAKSHDKTSKRAMTGLEMAEKEANKAARLAKKMLKQARKETREFDITSSTESVGLDLLFEGPPIDSQYPSARSPFGEDPTHFGTEDRILGTPIPELETSTEQSFGVPRQGGLEEERQASRLGEGAPWGGAQLNSGPPASTAPPRMEELGRSKRARAPTMKALEGLATAKRGRGRGRGARN
jgi:hypothetical protein